MNGGFGQIDILRSALDQAQEGIIILDSELRAQFMNRAVRRLWRVSDEQADGKPPYEELVTDSRRTGTYGVPPDELEAFIARRIALVRRGDPTPQDIRTGDGRFIRSQCTVLPGGGRMLSYIDVTDLVTNAAQLSKLAGTDPLTGVCNRRRFEPLAEAEVTRSQRYSRPLSMLMLDIDHFKQVNDRFGHAAGDEVIQVVANACALDQRASDVLGRIGGDEFAVLLPETDGDRACLAAERIRERVSVGAVKTGGGSFPITVSLGVAECSKSIAGAGALMRAADQALYAAKAKGRNCVVQLSATRLACSFGCRIGPAPTDLLQGARVIT